MDRQTHRHMVSKLICLGWIDYQNLIFLGMGLRLGTCGVPLILILRITQLFQKNTHIPPYKRVLGEI